MSVSFRCYKSTSPKVQGDLMWDTGAENLGLVSGKMTRRLVTPGDMSFTLHATHQSVPSKGSDDIGAFLNVYRVTVKNSKTVETLVFRCYVTNVEFDISGNVSYTAIDVLKLLDNSPWLVENTSIPVNVGSLMKSAITGYNIYCDPTFTTGSSTTWEIAMADGTPALTEDAQILEALKTLDGQNGAVKFRKSGGTEYIYDLHIKSYISTSSIGSLTLSLYMIQDSDMADAANSQHIVKGKNVISASMSYELPEHNAIFANNRAEGYSPTYDFTGDLKKNNIVCTQEAIDCDTVRPIHIRYTDATSAANLEALAREDIQATGYFVTQKISVEAFDLSYSDESIDPFDITRPVCIEGDSESDSIYTFMDEYVVDFVNPSSSRISVDVSPRITR